MIRIGEGPTATKRDEARVPNLREDHGWALLPHAPADKPTVRTRDQAQEASLRLACRRHRTTDECLVVS